MSEGTPAVENGTSVEDRQEAEIPSERVRVSNIHSTEIVHTLFGPSVGPCWGDFACHYHHQHGRLYASSNAVSFYSQLFGFERKICLYFQNVAELEEYRSTSIRITTVDSKQYVFKSFSDRSQVVRLLLQLQATGTAAELPTGPLDSSLTNDTSIMENETENMDGGDEEDAEEEEEEKEESTTPERPSTPLQPILRNGLPSSPHENQTKLSKRSKSLSCLDKETLVGDAIAHMPTATESDSSSTGSAPPETTHQDAWEETIKSSANYKETVVDALELSCDLKDFFNLFLANNAPFSMHFFQQDVIGDCEVETSSWTEDGHDTLTRTVAFCHPVTVKTYGFGPSSVRTLSRQRLRSFGSLGTSIETSSSIDGMPGADCFTVEGQWLLEPQGPGITTLTVRYDTRFSKRTVLKKMIQKSIRQETTSWYKSYADMVQNSLISEGRVRNDQLADTFDRDNITQKETPWQSTWRFYMLVGLIGIVFVSLLATVGLLLLHVVRLHQVLESLQDEIRQLRIENSESARQIPEAIAVSLRQHSECKSAD